MKINEFQTYQSVKFQQKQSNFFSARVPEMKDIKMELLSWGIMITTAKDQAIVSFNNIAYAKHVKVDGDESATSEVPVPVTGEEPKKPEPEQVKKPESEQAKKSETTKLKTKID